MLCTYLVALLPDLQLPGSLILYIFTVSLVQSGTLTLRVNSLLATVINIYITLAVTLIVSLTQCGMFNTSTDIYVFSGEREKKFDSK